ncbi:MAG: hypothetical protein NZ742_11965 [Acidobacteria bacterium]|nr:hypothetical protein [Acidobacteriota bacterium]MDW7985395.1 hypothetical protein [Acidobacteriota bacterium]
MRGAGGTPGGIGMFLLGLFIIAAGVYMFLSRVDVTLRRWYLGGYDAYGVILVIFALGLGILFFNARNVAGWILTLGSLAAIILSIVVNLDFYFRPTNLTTTLLMIGSIGIGLGLIFRSFRSATE